MQGAPSNEPPPFLQRASQHNFPARPQKPEANFRAHHEVDPEDFEAAAEAIGGALDDEEGAEDDESEEEDDDDERDHGLGYSDEAPSYINRKAMLRKLAKCYNFLNKRLGVRVEVLVCVNTSEDYQAHLKQFLYTRHQSSPIFNKGTSVEIAENWMTMVLQQQQQRTTMQRRYCIE